MSSPRNLDVTAVYSITAINHKGKVVEHSSIHVEAMREHVVRGREEPEKLPALVVCDIQMENLAVSCLGGGGPVSR